MTTSDGREAQGDTLLVALGREPQTKGIGLEALGIDSDGPLTVDARMQVVGHPWLYAIGDVNGKALFTHMGKYQARIVADHIHGSDTSLSHGADGPLSPRVIFTEPQVAAVGHTTDTAAEAGLDIQVVETSTSGNAGGSFYGRNAPGTSRLLIDRERRIVVGATITGAEVGELLHAATIAIVAEIPLDRLRHAVPCFPTRSEIWRPVADAGSAAPVQLEGRARQPSHGRRVPSTCARTAQGNKMTRRAGRFEIPLQPANRRQVLGGGPLTSMASLFATHTFASGGNLWTATPARKGSQSDDPASSGEIRDSSESEAVMTGELSFFEIGVEDAERGRAFYSALSAGGRAIHGGLGSGHCGGDLDSSGPRRLAAPVR